MRILFVWSAAEWSTFDVARGYRAALERAGHEIRDYRLYNHLKHHSAAFAQLGKEESDAHQVALAQLASESIVIDVIKFKPDLVLIVSGLSFHPNALWMIRELQALGFPTRTAVIHTESPYEDADQADFSELVDVTFTNDRTSAEVYDWHYLAHAYDPAVHRPVEPLWPMVAEAYAGDAAAFEPGPAPWCDVLILGTGWPERQQVLEGVDWTGIDLRILGLWPGITEDSPLASCYRPIMVRNEKVADVYAGARIVLNFHRADATAWSVNPRIREIAACGVFQLSDHRAELEQIFGRGRTVLPTFAGSQELEDLVRFYLEHGDRRREMARRQHVAVTTGPHTFDDRVTEIMAVLSVKHGGRATPNAAAAI